MAKVLENGRRAVLEGRGASKVGKSSSPRSARNCTLNAVRARTCGASRGDRWRQAGLRLPQGPGVQEGIGRRRSNSASGTPYRSPALFLSLATYDEVPVTLALDRDAARESLHKLVGEVAMRTP